MVKKLFLIIAMLLSLGLSVQGVTAQDAGPEGLTMDPADVAGLESGYSRTYSADMDALMASPSADGLDLSALMRNVSIMTYGFESDKDAKAFFSDMQSQMNDDLAKSMSEMGEVEISDLTEIDKDGVKVTINMADLGVGMTILMFIDGDTVFAVTVMDVSLDGSTTMALDVANFIIDADVKDEDVTFHEDGTSTGGVFDRMPASGDDIVGGLISTVDVDLFAETPGQ